MLLHSASILRRHEKEIGNEYITVFDLTGEESRLIIRYLRVDEHDVSIHRQWIAIAKPLGVRQLSWWPWPKDLARAMDRDSMHQKWYWMPSKWKRRMPRCATRCHWGYQSPRNGISISKHWKLKWTCIKNCSNHENRSFFSTHRQNPMRMAKIERHRIPPCEQSARNMAKRLNSLFTTNTKNRIKQMSDATNANNPKKSPFEAPTQSTRPERARWAIATARRDNITSKRCSKSSSLPFA